MDDTTTGGTGTSPAARFLVVDDEESIVDMMATALRFVGYDVATEVTGFDALRAVKATPPDLIVLDEREGRQQ